MKTFLTFRFSRRAACAGLAGWFLMTGAAAASVVIPGDPADYEAQREDIAGSPATVSAARGSAEELRVFARDTGGFLFEEGRPIFQFDLSVLEQPAQSATFAVELLSVSANTALGIEAWGVSSNRSGPLGADDSGAAGQFAAAGYELAHDSQAVLGDESSAPGTLFQDITSYVNDRYEEFQEGGDSWVYLRLQFDESVSFGSGIDAEFTLASADHSNEDFHPYLEVVPIPEPRNTVLAITGLTALFVVARRMIRSRFA